MNKYHCRKLWLSICVFTAVFCFAFGCSPESTIPMDSAPEATNDNNIEEVGLPSWSPSLDCTSCHSYEVDSGTNNSCLYSKHEIQAVECTACHNDTSNMTKAHEKYSTAKDPKKLRFTEVPDDICQSCHDINGISEKTVLSSVLTDNRGTIVNPHGIPANSTHEANVTCSACHKMHKPESIEETSRDVCLACHHDGVYECHTCHE